MRTQRNLLLIAVMLLLFSHFVYGIEGAAQMGAMEQKLERQAVQLKDKQEQIEILEIILEHQDEEAEPEKKCLGEFEITYYTAGPESTGKTPDHPAYGITRSGTTVKEGQTIAADWSILEPGTKVYIEGVGERVVEDTGGDIVGNSIDVYCKSYEEAIKNGRHKANVYILN